MNIYAFLILILATHSIAHTIATQILFKPLRDWLGPKLGEFWGHLIKCPYCLGYHTAWVLLLIFYSLTGRLVVSLTSNFVFDFFLGWMGIAAVANYLTWILCDKIKKPKEDVNLQKSKDYEDYLSGIRKVS